MRRLRAAPRLALGLVVTFGWLCPAPAAAFCRTTTCSGEGCELDANKCKVTGEKLFWSGGCAGVSLQQDGSAHIPFEQISAAVNHAIAAWSNATCADGTKPSIDVVRMPDVACDKVEINNNGPNVNVIVFRDNYFVAGGDGDTLATTTVTYSVKTGEISGADMEVNATTQQLTATDDVAVHNYDLQSVLTHEMGHFLGIAHSPNTDATMFFQVGPGDAHQRVLTDDDIAAICEAYPATRNVGCDPTPKGGFKGDCPDVAETKSCSTSPAAPGPSSLLMALGVFMTAGIVRRLRAVVR